MTTQPEGASVAAWRDWAKADAERRGLPQLSTLIDGLSTTITRLRLGDWNLDARHGAGASEGR